jgi:hypothetical protein
MSSRDQWACVLCVFYTLAGIVAVGATTAGMLARYEATVARYEHASEAAIAAAASANAYGEALGPILAAHGEAPYQDWYLAGYRAYEWKVSLERLGRVRITLHEDRPH